MEDEGTQDNQRSLSETPINTLQSLEPSLWEYNEHKRKMFLCLRHMLFLIFVCQNVGLRRTVQHVFFALPLPWTSRYHMNIVYHAVALPIYIF